MDDHKNPADLPLRLMGRFGQAREARSPQNYVREDAPSLLDSVRALLALSVTGDALLSQAATGGVSVQLLRGREENFYVPEGGQVMLVVGPRTQKATPFLALMLAGGLREALQNLRGFVRPNPEAASAEDRFVMGAGKELDIINTLCLILSDMEKTPHRLGFLEAMEGIGYLPIYEAFKAGATPEDMMAILLKDVKTKES